MQRTLLQAVLVVCLIPTFCATAETPAVKAVDFRGTTFLSAFVDAKGSGGQRQIINEYIPAGEKLDSWTQMIGLYEFPGQQDFERMAGQLVKTLKEQAPQANFAIHRNEAGDRVMVDFLVWRVGPSMAEFNIFIYQRSENGDGVLAQQFALRAYGDDVERFLVDLKDLRPKLLEAVTDFQFPAVTVPSSR